MQSPNHPFVDLIGWYGEWENSGCASFLFAAMVPDAGGQMLLWYTMSHHEKLWDHSVPPQGSFPLGKGVLWDVHHEPK